MSKLSKKLFSLFTAFSLAVMMLPAVPAKALTAEELQAQIAALQAQLAQLTAQLAQMQGGQTTQGTSSQVPAVCANITFTRNLKLGMSGNDVKCLQALLNQSSDTQVAKTGAGSPGKETTYFGLKTKVAVISFQEKYAADILTPYGLTKGTGFVGLNTREKLNSLLSSTAQTEEQPTGQTQPTGTGLTISLSSDSPVSGTVVAGQALADLAHFKFVNGDATEVKVTQLKLKRLGISADATLDNVYLYDGNTRLTDAASVSSGYITFADSAGLFTIGAGQTKVISVKSDITSSIQGQTLGVAIYANTDVVSNASALNGTFPISSNLMTVASATLAGATLSGSAGPSAQSVNPGETDFIVWSDNLTISTHKVNLKYLRLREIGSISAGDLKNFSLYVNGEKVAGPVQMSSDYYVAFDLTSASIQLLTGVSQIQVKADIINGSSRTYSFSLRTSADILLEDAEYGVPIRVSSGIPATSGTQTINSGSVTVVKATDSPNGAVVKGASQFSVAKFTLTAYGEKVKVESLTVKVDDGSGVDIGGLDNGALYVNGAQIGSTKDITLAGVTYNLGSSLILEPGNPVNVEVKADIRKANGTDLTANNLRVTLVAGSNNAQALTSYQLLSVPGSPKEGNILSIGTGDLIVAKNNSYGDQTTIGSVQGYKLGSFVLSTGDTEDVQITGFTVGIGGSADRSNLSNLYVKYGSYQTTPKSQVQSQSSFSVSYTMAKNSQMVVDVYADLGSASSGTHITSLTVTATTKVSNQYLSKGPVTGQIITLSSASLSAALDTGTPQAQLVVADNQNILVGKYKFTAQNADVTLNDIYVKLFDGNANDTVIGAKLDLNNDGTPDTPLVYPAYASYCTGTANSTSGATTITVPNGKGAEFTAGDYIVIYDGSTYQTKQISATSSNTLTIPSTSFATTSVFVGAYVYGFTGVNLTVSKNTPSVIGVYLDLNDVVTNGQSGDNAQVALYQYKWTAGGSQTVAHASGTEFTGLLGNEAIVRRTKPTVASVSASSNFTNGELVKFSITADPKADLNLYSVNVETILNDIDTTTDLYISGIALYDASDLTTALNDTVETSTNNGSNWTTTTRASSQVGRSDGLHSLTVDIKIDNNSGTPLKVIPAGQTVTFVVKATINNASAVQGDTITSRVIDANPSTPSYDAIKWGDQQVANIDSKYVKVLPTNSNTLNTY